MTILFFFALNNESLTFVGKKRAEWGNEFAEDWDAYNTSEQQKTKIRYLVNRIKSEIEKAQNIKENDHR